MPLYSVMEKPAKLVKTKKTENYELLLKAKEDLHAKTFDRIVKTYDEYLDAITEMKGAKLVYTKTAIIVGHHSPVATAKVNHIWDNIEKVLPMEKHKKMCLGGFLRWRISVRDETWLTFVEKREERDPDTGKKITVSHYWVDDNFDPKNDK